MNGKQSSTILYNDTDHMDVFHLMPGTHVQKDWHYWGPGLPTFCNALAICDSETPYHLQNVWRKVFDDDWLKDSYYFVSYNSLPYSNYYGDTLRKHTLYSFVEYKQMCTMTSDLRSDCYGYGGNGVVALKETNYYWGAYTSFYTSWNDPIDGKNYDFSDNPKRYMLISQNGRDWYPFFFGKKYDGMTIQRDENTVVFAKGEAYILVVNNKGQYSWIHKPFEISEEDSSITCSTEKYLTNSPKMFTGVDTTWGPYIHFAIDENLYTLFKKTDTVSSGVYHYSLRLNSITPDDKYNTKLLLDGDGNNAFHCDPISLATVNNKKYFYVERQIGKNTAPMIWDQDPKYGNVESIIFSIDENGNYAVVRKELFKQEYFLENSYNPPTTRMRLIPNKLASFLYLVVHDMNNGLRVYYDEKTKYYYMYSWVRYGDPNFPKGSGNYKRIMVARTKDFKTFTYHEVPPYRIMKGMLNKNSAAIYFDSKYEDELLNNYIVNQRNIFEYMGGWCFHNEKPCSAHGIFCVGQMRKKGQTTYSDFTNLSYVWYFYDYLLQENEKDFLYALKEYDKDGNTAIENDSQTIMNKLYGLDYPGKDVE